MRCHGVMINVTLFHVTMHYWSLAPSILIPCQCNHFCAEALKERAYLLITIPALKKSSGHDPKGNNFLIQSWIFNGTLPLDRRTWPILQVQVRHQLNKWPKWGPKDELSCKKGIGAGKWGLTRICGFYGTVYYRLTLSSPHLGPGLKGLWGQAIECNAIIN